MRILLPYQKEWLNASGHSIYILVKSRRIGGTFLTALRCVFRAVKGRNQYYSSYKEDACKNFIRYCGIWLRAYNKLAKDRGKPPVKIDQLINIIRLDNGAEIVGIPSNEINLRDRQGDLIIDEAAYRDLEALLDAGSAISIWGGSIDILSSQSWEDTYFNRLYNQIKEGIKPGYCLEIPFRRAIEEGFYKKVCEKNNIPWSEEGEQKYIAQIYELVGYAASWELDCIPRTGQGGLISIDRFHFIDTLPDEDGLYYRSWDLAGTADEVAKSTSFYTANVLCFVTLDRIYVIGGEARRNSPTQNHNWFEEVNQTDRGVIQVIEGEPADHSAGYLELVEQQFFKDCLVIVVKPNKNKLARALPMFEAVKRREVVFLESARHIVNELIKIDQSRKIPKVQDYTDALSNLYGEIRQDDAPTLGE